MCLKLVISRDHIRTNMNRKCITFDLDPSVKNVRVFHYHYSYWKYDMENDINRHDCYKVLFLSSIILKMFHWKTDFVLLGKSTVIFFIFKLSIIQFPIIPCEPMGQFFNDVLDIMDQTYHGSNISWINHLLFKTTTLLMSLFLESIGLSSK